MFTKHTALAAIVLLFVVSSVSAAEERRVWVYDAGTKPATAARTGHYELRRVSGKRRKTKSPRSKVLFRKRKASRTSTRAFAACART